MAATSTAVKYFIILLCLGSSPVASFVTSNRRCPAARRPTLSTLHSSSETNTEPAVATSNDDSPDDADDDITPYRNRDLAYTRKYRRLVPYKAARLTAMRLGLRSKEEWDDIRQFGRAFHGAHLVAYPNEMYAKEWVSWEEFLGVMRPYDEVKDMVQNELKLKTMEEYRAYINEDKKRAEWIRIPAKPEIFYRKKGWEGEAKFFGQKD